MFDLVTIIVISVWISLIYGIYIIVTINSDLLMGVMDKSITNTKPSPVEPSPVEITDDEFFAMLGSTPDGLVSDDALKMTKTIADTFLGSKASSLITEDKLKKANELSKSFINNWSNNKEFIDALNGATGILKEGMLRYNDPSEEEQDHEKCE